MWQIILTAFALSIAINLAMFGLAYWKQSDKLTDVSYAATFLTLAVYGLAAAGPAGAQTVLLTVLVALWALRLGGFLLYRVVKKGRDPRFDGIRENFRKFAVFWLGQALTAWLLMVPVLWAQTGPAALAPVTYVGVAVFLAGFIIESLADLQKYRFNQNPANDGKWIESGVWHYSRHPNYFGEMLVWIGLYLAAFSALYGWQQLAGLVSPLFIIMMLRFVSGVPPLERSAEQRWGDDPDYQRYKHQTGLLIPRPRGS